MEFNQFNMEQTLYEGDLCVLDGYGNRVWEVVGFTFQKSQMSGKVTEEIIYDLSCITSTEWNIGTQSETELVCKAAYAYQYVKELDDEGLPPSYDSKKQKPKRVKKGGATMTNKPVDKEAKVPYIYPETIDGQLEKLSDLNCLVEEFTASGEDTSKLKSEIKLVNNKLSIMLNVLKQEL